MRRAILSVGLSALVLFGWSALSDRFFPTANPPSTKVVNGKPVPLPKPERRGQTCHLAIECRAHQITVLLDGQKIHAQDDAGLRTGAVGFRAAGPAEQGRFRHVSLTRL